VETVAVKERRTRRLITSWVAALIFMNIIKRHKIITTALLLTFIVMSYLYGGTVAGFTEAQYDIHFSTPKYIIIGEAFRHDSLFASTLSVKYGIRAKRIAGCVVSPPEITYSEGYNSVVHHYVMNKYGRDVISDLYKELYQQK
jgi:hypothetical protein